MPQPIARSQYRASCDPSRRLGALVQRGGRHVTEADVSRARGEGATDKEIHDTVLIAAAFCMYNRYVDGLATWAPTDPELYRENGKRLAEQGYVESTSELASLREERA